MTNATVHTRLAEAISAHTRRIDYNHPRCGNCRCGFTVDLPSDYTAHLADVLLALPDIAVIELPEPSYVDEPEAGEKGYGFNGDQGDSRLASERGLYVHDGLIYDQYDSVTPADARKVASWWAAAAVVAERKEQP